MEKPIIIDNPDLTGLRKIIQEYIDFVDSDEYHEDNDFRHRLFEAAVETFLGNNAFDFINDRTE